MDKMDKLIGEISALRLSNASYDERFAGMNNRMLDMNKDIAVLQADVKILTHNYDSCQYCGNKNKQ